MPFTLLVVWCVAVHLIEYSSTETNHLLKDPRTESSHPRDELKRECVPVTLAGDKVYLLYLQELE